VRDVIDPSTTSLIERLGEIVRAEPELVEYQKGKSGLAAMPYEHWMKQKLTGEGKFTLEELGLLPPFAFRTTIPSLYNAIYKARRRKSPMVREVRAS
jgi:hypothetical protein